jgi:low temperature requirement protein LtrA
MLITLIVTLIVIGVLLWAITQIPMDDTMRKIVRVVVIVLAVLWVVSVLFPGALPLGALR